MKVEPIVPVDPIYRRIYRFNIYSSFNNSSINKIYLKARNIAGDTSYNSYIYTPAIVNKQAILEVRTQDMKNTFKFRLGSKTQIGNFDNNTYYVYDACFIIQQPGPINSMMDASDSIGAIKPVTAETINKHDRENLVPHDFVYYLANLIKQDLSPPITLAGVSSNILKNANRLIQNIRDLSGELNSKIQRSISGASGELTDTDTSNNNLCRELFRQMYFEEPQRFNTIPENQITPLPFEPNDFISFNLDITPTYGTRYKLTYPICLKMVSDRDPSNTQI